MLVVDVGNCIKSESIEGEVYRNLPPMFDNDIMDRQFYFRDFWEVVLDK